MPAWLETVTLAQAVTLAVALSATLAVVVKAWPWASRLVHLVDDLAGERERPGVPARPGIMARLADLEAGAVRRDEQIATIHHQVTPNGGGSIKDVVHRTEGKVDGLSTRLAAAEASHAELDRRVADEVDRARQVHEDLRALIEKQED